MDNLERFLELRNALEQEKAEILNRIEEIDNVLGGSFQDSSGLPLPRRRRREDPGSSPRRGAASGQRGSANQRKLRKQKNGKSLKEAVVEALGSGKKTKPEILLAVQKSGYQFTTKNPMNSLGVILYGKSPKFRNEGGYFSVA